MTKRLVEEVGRALYAGWLARLTRATRRRGGVATVGGRRVRWVLDESGAVAVAVAHAPADRRRRALRYSVRVVTTRLPSGGDRWWWSCPGCRRRADALYLPPERDRLGCRKCCGLAYASQYPTREVRRRQGRPRIVVTRERRRWTRATGWVVLWRRRTRVR